MPTFEDAIHSHFDERMRTLGRIKTRSLGADTLTLTALNVLVYAQLEGGVKDLASCVLRALNRHNLELGQIKPGILNWRNSDDIARFKAAIDFEQVGTATPFGTLLSKRVKIRPINRRYELNQMGWPAIRTIYRALSLDDTNITPSRATIEQLVDDRNDAAHYGNLPQTAVAPFERLVRSNAAVVELVLTDFSLQLLSFFTKRLHRR